MNRVLKTCYNCDAVCTIEIPRIAHEFADFNLDNPNSEQIQSLTHEQKLELKKYVEEDNFYCGFDSCNSVFEIEILVLPPWSGNKTRVTI